MSLPKSLSVALFISLASGSAWADGHMKPDLAIKESLEGTMLMLEVADPPKGLRNLVLTVTGPRGYALSQTTDATGFKLDLRDYGKPFDGAYRWEITGATGETIEVNTPIDENGRTRAARREHAVAARADGNFAILEGRIVQVDRELKE